MCLVFTLYKWNMGNDLRSLCQVEAKRLVLVVLLIFASFIVVQYVELPYSTTIRSLFSSEKPQVTGLNTFSNANEPNYTNVLGNMTEIQRLIPKYDGIEDTNVQISNNSEEKDIRLKNDFVLKKNGNLNDSLDIEETRSDPEDEPFSKDSIHSMEDNDTDIPVNALSPTVSPNSAPAGNNLSLDKNSKVSLIFRREKNLSIVSDPVNPSLPPPPLSTTPSLNIGTHVNISQTPLISVFHGKSSVEKGNINSRPKDKKSVEFRKNVPPRKKGSAKPLKPVSISDMNEILLQSRSSSFSMKPRWSSEVDQELRNAKLQIENAHVVENYPGVYAPLFRNVSMFMRSYELMEQTLKVYVYKEGERPIFHTPVLKGIYASEGWFMKLLKANKNFMTKNPKKAHLFYLPFSSRMLEETLYVPNSHKRKNLVECLKNYVDVIAQRYRFWNRTGGADHFLVACHDWAPSETNRAMPNCIRALCNSDVKQGFKFGKDVSLPETYVRRAQNPLKELGGKPPSQRTILSFFAGNMHGYLRPMLLQYWENKDPDMKIFGRMPKSKGNFNYIMHMKTSKYCICAKGYEVNSPRVVEAIFYECVPVMISDDFIPPFFDVLNWESFAVFVSEKDIPNLKNILLSIPIERYLEMYKRVKEVQKHFLWNVKPVKYDIFHMILHSIWFNRVFRMRPV